jgi:hypothetical protein
VNLNSIVLFVHVFGAFILFMAVAIEVICLHRMRGATTTDQLREWASLTRTTAKPLPLSTVAILASGLYMGLTVWNLTVPWIGASLAVVAVMFVVGPAVNSRRLDAIAHAAKTAPSGPIPAALEKMIQDPVLLASVHTSTALGFGIVFLKAVRPDLAGTLAAMVAAVAIGLLTARFASGGGSVRAEVSGIAPQVTDEAA